MSIDAIKSVFERSVSSGSDRVMLLAIAEHLNEKGLCWPSMERLARMCNTSPRQAIRLVENLRQLGELAVQRSAGPKGANLYRVTLPTPDKRVTPDIRVTPDADDTPDTYVTPDTQGRGGDIQGSSPLTPMSPKPLMNPQEPPLTSTLPLCPHENLLDLFGKHLPMLPQPRRELWSGKNADAMRARWRWVLTAAREGGERYATTPQEAVDFFARFFGHVAGSDFLCGRSGKWSCDLGWLMKADNFAKVVQGNYDNKAEATFGKREHA